MLALPGVVLFRWDAPLFFTNAEMFRESILRAVSAAPTKTRWVVAAAEPVTDVDSTAVEVLAELDDELQRSGIQLCFARMKGPVKGHLMRYGPLERIGAAHFFPTQGQSVTRFVELHQVPWVDWENAAAA